MPHRFPMPPRRQPALQGAQGGSDGSLTPDDYDHAAQRLDACSAALRAAADEWRASPQANDPRYPYASYLTIANDLVATIQALMAVAAKVGKG